MDLRFSDEEEGFRVRARTWLEGELGARGGFADLRGRGGPGDEHADVAGRLAWERHLGASGWSCLGWPSEFGGQARTLMEQVIFHEEYARAEAPGRLGHIGETLLGPTLIALGTDEQKRRLLPPIVRGDELWCQGYSEPNAGSDLANVQTRAQLVGDEWVITGQKIWTSLAHVADWCFVLCRTHTETGPSAPRHRGLTYLLVPMRQPAITIRPIAQLTGTSEFNEVFFDEARTARDNVVGAVDGGWKVAMATLGFERGASTLGQQLAFDNQLRDVIRVAEETSAIDDPVMRQRLARAHMGLRIMRLNALRMLTLSSSTVAAPSNSAFISKLFWSNWHRDLGELAMDVLGPRAELTEPKTPSEPYSLTPLQRLFLFTRSDTIYAGSNEIQRNIIGERALDLPPEPRATEARILDGK